jgi:ubiquinone/menaquinone biosynthesis C-methylase UbiE
MIDRRQPAQSGYTAVDEAIDATKYVRRLDQMRTDNFWQAVKAQTFELLDLRPDSRVLDVGCGTGDDVLTLATLVGPGGRAVGVDSSATMIDEASRRAAAAHSSAEFSLGDARSLDFPDASFDGCRAERILQHMDAPEQVVRELARVVRPGGCIVLVEPDYGTLSLTGADESITRRIVNVRREHFRSGSIGRELPRLSR